MFRKVGEPGECCSLIRPHITGFEKSVQTVVFNKNSVGIGNNRLHVALKSCLASLPILRKYTKTGLGHITLVVVVFPAVKHLNLTRQRFIEKSVSVFVISLCLIAGMHKKSCCQQIFINPYVAVAVKLQPSTGTKKGIQKKLFFRIGLFVFGIDLPGNRFISI